MDIKNLINKQNIAISLKDSKLVNNEVSNEKLSKFINEYNQYNLVHYKYVEDVLNIQRNYHNGLWNGMMSINIIKNYINSNSNDVKEGAKDTLTNFYRWDGTRGFGAIGEIVDYEANSSKYINDTTLLYERFIKMTENINNVDLNSLLLPYKYGNLFGFRYDDKVLTKMSFRHLYYGLQVRDLVKNNKENTILEIGGGWGSSAYQIINNIPNSKFVFMDLPEVLFILSFFLSMNFPHKKIYTFKSNDKISDIINNNDIVLIPSNLAFAYKLFPENLVDVVINNHSLVEMDTTYISAYIKLINWVTKKNGFFYTNNHNHFFELSDVINSNTKWENIYINPEYLAGDEVAAGGTSERYKEYLYKIK